MSLSRSHYGRCTCWATLNSCAVTCAMSSPVLCRTDVRSVVLSPPVKSVLTSVNTLTQRRGCCLVSASDDTISNACIDLCTILLAAHVMDGLFFSSDFLFDKSVSGHTSQAITRANGGASFTLTRQADEDTALPDPWCTVPALVVL